MKEDRVAKAIALFKEGYNCSQSVVAAFADEYGFTREQALRMAASFGGGIGRNVWGGLWHVPACRTRNRGYGRQ